jgi:hypothetical protein
LTGDKTGNTTSKVRFELRVDRASVDLPVQIW